MERVMIVGSMGAGKSTLAKQLAAITELPLVHLDTHFWRPDWIEPDRAEWRVQHAGLIAAPRWIMDGGYGGTMDARIHRADLIIWLDTGRWRWVVNALWRRIRYHGRTRTDMHPACPEKLDLRAIKWILEYPRAGRVRLQKHLDYAQCPIIRLRSRREVARFLKRIAHPVGDTP